MKTILIANRGEIAVRIIRACRDLGLGTVAVYSECDRAALHVRMADRACPIGGNSPAESYLHIERLVAAALGAGADAVHPGYGFLSEQAAFARACRDAGLGFVGPSPEAIGLMGDKVAARRIAAAAGVPVVPGLDAPLSPDASEEAVVAAGATVGYPLLVKAVAGGGGKGMRVAGLPDDLLPAIRLARSEATTAFGDGTIYLERRLVRPRHIEVQVLADAHGTVVPFVERECSVQRRHQKVIEETPSPVVGTSVRRRMAEAAVAVAKAVGYVNAGTVEFLLDGEEHFYFLEMNTRLQVEHPITELVTGVDLVAWQLRIAAGEPLRLAPEALLTPRGHAIECRVYAEDPDAGFLPSPGRISALRTPEGPGIRLDSGVAVGSDVPLHYDPLLAKLSVWGEDRDQAIARLRRALDEFEVIGVSTTLPFFRWMLRQPVFDSAAYHTAYLDEVLASRNGEPFWPAGPGAGDVAAIAAALRLAGAARATVEGDGKPETPPQGRGPGWRYAARIEGLRS
ncbi:MAG: acetyl-CoA carboxylase biotin carboxylase subunit [Acidobacteria bacterium]|nr:acetyl-CoA carboxylase biotin carboxylase subunit [Acidobacteriota bacterium]